MISFGFGNLTCSVGGGGESAITTVLIKIVVFVAGGETVVEDGGAVIVVIGEHDGSSGSVRGSISAGDVHVRHCRW